ncbi:MAG: hypothetical protein WD576_03495 [Nitriliruptoraceae bacterium]
MSLATIGVGVMLLLLGAVGATVTQRRLEASRRGRWVPLALIPHGILVGGGAALLRGWNVTTAMAFGAVVVPLVAVIGRLWEVRRTRARG